MKFKKEIATLLLASTLLTASLTGCNTAQNGGDDIDNTTTEITTIETTPETPNTNEVTFEEPVVGENITCSLFSPSESINGLEMRAGTGVYKFYPADDSKNRYFYIEQWDQVLKFTDGTDATFVYDVLVTEDYLYVLAQFNASFLIDSYQWMKVITMKIDRNGTIVESHINRFEWNTRFTSAERIYYNLYSPEQFYITHTDKGDADDPNGKWQIQVYESTDMGKSWSPKGAPIGGTDGRLDIGDFFLTREVGYFAYIRDELTHQYDVYTTTDGGGTWQLQPFSCIDPNEEYYVKFNGIIVYNDEYVASFKAEKRLEGKGDEEKKVTFICKSNDFTEWTLTATRPQSSPSPYEEELGNEYYVLRNFINDQVGYTFVFFDDTEFLTLLKTTDGGKTWERQPIVDAPEPSMHLGIDDAKMFTEDTGFIKKLWHGDGKIYVTTDGGRTWERPDYGAPKTDDKYGYNEELSIEYVDGKYVLSVRHREASVSYITQYESTDLKKWTFEQTFDASLCTGTWYDSQMPPNEIEISSVSEGKIECHLRVLQLDAFDDFDLTVTLQNGKYIFTDKNELISGTIQFKEDSILVVVEQSNTDDLQSGDSWSFTIKDTIVRTIYSSSEGDGSGKVVCKYEYSKSGSMVYLQIDAWNQTLVLPFTYEHIVEIKFASLTATIVGDKGFFVYQPDPNETTIKILSFTKGSDEITEQTITWDEAICQSDIFCNFINDEIGYIFVIEEGGHSGFAHGYQKISKLYKTQDGGQTWNSLNCDNIPYISLREPLRLAKFVTEDIGIIAGHLFADDFDFHERTYITKDGGLSWSPVDLSAFADLFAYQVLDIEAYDLQYTNGTYYLYVEDRGEPTPEGVSKPCYIFTSTDGIEWNYLKQVN